MLRYGPVDMKDPAFLGVDAGNQEALRQRTAVIVCPPWPRSGAAWIIRNQIDHYSARGWKTALIVVPINRWYMRDSAIWENIERGFEGVGADRFFIAPLDAGRYRVTKYAATFMYAARGSILDWQFAVAKSAALSEDLGRFLRSLSGALVHANHVQTSGFAKKLQRLLLSRNATAPVIVETHDIQAQLMVAAGERNPWTKEPDTYEKMIRSEKRLLREADVLVHLSMDDMKFFKSALLKSRHALVLPTINQEFIASVKAAPPLETPIDLLFVGQNHGPNVAALKWFFEQVWPILQGKQYRLSIVGAVRTLFRDNHRELFDVYQPHFQGEVVDLAPYYRSARCVIAPMVMGSGISIKTIEALALCMPFVGTSHAFRGMPIEEIKAAGLQPRDTPSGFAEGITDALTDPGAWGGRSRHVYEQLFSVQANFAARDRVLAAAGMTCD